MTPAHRAIVAHDTDQQRQYLTFLLGGETFAIGILAIKEIIEYGTLTELPMAPPYVRGIINLRGAALPVMDLAVRFGRAQSVVGKRTSIVIVEAERDGRCEHIGLVVDAVDSVLDIPAADVEPPPRFGSTFGADFIRGLGKIDGRFVMLLDTERVLAVEDRDALELPPPARSAA